MVVGVALPVGEAGRRAQGVGLSFVVGPFLTLLMKSVRPVRQWCVIAPSGGRPLVP